MPVTIRPADHSAREWTSTDAAYSAEYTTLKSIAPLGSLRSKYERFPPGCFRVVNVHTSDSKVKAARVMEVIHQGKGT